MFLLGVRPNLRIKNNITKSVTVLNPLQIRVHNTMKNPTKGDMMNENTKMDNIFNTDLNKINTKLNKGVALIKNP